MTSQSQYANGQGQSLGMQVVLYAANFLGVPYVYGGTTPQTGFDCSGLVEYVYQKFGVNLPRTSQDQANAGDVVPYSSAQPGDLLIYTEPGEGPDSHVGIYVGQGEQIEAPHTGADVRYSPVDLSHLTRVVRPLSNGTPTVTQANWWDDWLKALGNAATGDPFVPGNGPGPNTNGALGTLPDLNLGLGALGGSLTKTAITGVLALGAVALVGIGLYRGTVHNSEGAA